MTNSYIIELSICLLGLIKFIILWLTVFLFYEWAFISVLLKLWVYKVLTCVYEFVLIVWSISFAISMIKFDFPSNVLCVFTALYIIVDILNYIFVYIGWIIRIWYTEYWVFLIFSNLNSLWLFHRLLLIEQRRWVVKAIINGCRHSDIICMGARFLWLNHWR